MLKIFGIITKKNEIMNDSGLGRGLLAFLSGAALGAVIGILYAPDKGEKTRKVIVKKSKDFKDAVTERLEDLVESAEEIVDELKDTAADFVQGRKNESGEIVTAPKAPRAPRGRKAKAK